MLLGLQDTGVEWEYMRQFPLSFPRHIYSEARARIVAATGMSLDQLLLTTVLMPRAQYNSAPLAISEFNILGAYVHHFHRESMLLMEWTGNSTTPLTQYRSFILGWRLRREKHKPIRQVDPSIDREICGYIGEEPGCLEKHRHQGVSGT